MNNNNDKHSTKSTPSPYLYFTRAERQGNVTLPKNLFSLAQGWLQNLIFGCYVIINTIRKRLKIKSFTWRHQGNGLDFGRNTRSFNILTGVIIFPTPHLNEVFFDVSWGFIDLKQCKLSKSSRWNHNYFTTLIL